MEVGRWITLDTARGASVPLTYHTLIHINWLKPARYFACLHLPDHHPWRLGVPAVSLPVFVGGERLPLPVKVTYCVDPDALRQHLEMKKG